MGRFDALKTTIDANIRENGNQEITGEILNLVLNEMVSVVDEEKQDLLMDGVNIKTINGQKILGRGNITIEGGGGGITEEKEVYIGTDTPTDDGAKLWIDPTGTPSGGNGGNASGGEGNGTIIKFYRPYTVASGYKDLTETQKEQNAESFAKVVKAFEDNSTLPTIIMVNSEVAAGDAQGLTGLYGGDVMVNFMLIAPNSVASELFEMPDGGLTIVTYKESFAINHDGSVTINS